MWVSLLCLLMFSVLTKSVESVSPARPSYQPFFGPDYQQIPPSLPALLSSLETLQAVGIEPSVPALFAPTSAAIPNPTYLTFQGAICEANGVAQEFHPCKSVVNIQYPLAMSEGPEMRSFFSLWGGLLKLMKRYVLLPIINLIKKTVTKGSKKIIKLEKPSSNRQTVDVEVYEKTTMKPKKSESMKENGKKPKKAENVLAAKPATKNKKL